MATLQRVYGYLIDSELAGIPNIQVKMEVRDYLSDEWIQNVYATSDASGLFQVFDQMLKPNPSGDPDDRYYAILTVLPDQGWEISGGSYSSTSFGPNTPTLDFGLHMLDSTATEAFYSISGSITGVTTEAISVKLYAGGVLLNQTTADSSGDYIFPLLPEGEEYTVIPSYDGYVFTPAESDPISNVGADAVVDAFTFVAPPAEEDVYTIHGLVRKQGAAVPPVPEQGVTVAYDDGAGQSGSVVSTNSGSYSITGLTNGTFTLTATKDGVEFNTPITVEVADADAEADDIVSYVVSLSEIYGNVIDVLPELEGLDLFVNPIDSVDFDVLNNRLYVATGSNYLIRWNGSQYAEYVSDVWETNYEKPSLVKAYAGRLAVTGFMKSGMGQLKSELRFTELDNPFALSDNVFIIRTADTESPTAMMPLTARTNEGPLGSFIRAGLVIAKKSSITLFMGDDLTDFSDVNIVPHSRVGCSGPQAWDYVPGGVAFVGRDGVFVIDGPQPARDVAVAISPMFGRETTSSAPVRRIHLGELSKASVAYDVLRGTLHVAVPLANTAKHRWQQQLLVEGEMHPLDSTWDDNWYEQKRQWIMLVGSQAGAWSEWDTFTTPASYPLKIKYDRDDSAVVVLTTSCPTAGDVPPIGGSETIVIGPLWRKSSGAGTRKNFGMLDQWPAGSTGEIELHMAFTALGDTHRPKRLISSAIEVSGDPTDDHRTLWNGLLDEVNSSFETWVDNTKVSTSERELLENIGRSIGVDWRLGIDPLVPYKKVVERFPAVAAAKGTLIKHVFRTITSGTFKIHSIRMRFAQNAKTR